MQEYRYIHGQSRKHVRGLRKQAAGLLQAAIDAQPDADQYEACAGEAAAVAAIDAQILEIVKGTLELMQGEQAAYSRYGFDASDSKEIDWMERTIAYWQGELELAQQELERVW